MSQIVTDSLLAYYNSKRGVNGDIWENISPATVGSYNAVITGATAQPNGMYFGSENDKVALPIFYSLKEKTNQTIELRLNLTEYNETEILTGNSRTALAVSIFVDSPTSMYLEVPVFDWWIYPYYYMTSDEATNQDVFISMVYDYTNNNVVLYVNGLLASTLSMPTDNVILGSSDTAFNIGGIYNSPIGVIDNLRFYNKALTAEEVNQNYLVGSELGISDSVSEPPPNVTIISVSREKISDEASYDISMVSFEFDIDVEQWTTNVMGVSHDTGTIADSGGAVLANNPITATIDFTELYQEGSNRINIYGKNIDGVWTPHES